MMGERKKPFPKDKAVKGRKVKAQPSKARKKEKAKTRAKPDRISLVCDGSGMGGFSWRSEVHFVGNTKSYRVWRKCEEDRKRILIKHAHEPLSLRRMVADIQELDDLGDLGELEGELLEEIEVTGADDWEAAILRMAWCKSDSLAYEQLEFLLALQDESIALLSDWLGELSLRKALSALAEVIESAKSMHIDVSVLEQGIQAMEVTPPGSIRTWRSTMKTWLKNHQPDGPSLADIAEIRTAEQMVILVKGPSPNDRKVAALLLQRWVEADPKPKFDGVLSNIGTYTTATFFQWLIKRVGPIKVATLAAGDAALGKRVAEEFLKHADSQIDSYRRVGGVAGPMSMALARGWVSLKTQVLANR